MEINAQEVSLIFDLGIFEMCIQPGACHSTTMNSAVEIAQNIFSAVQQVEKTALLGSFCTSCTAMRKVLRLYNS